MWKNTITWNVLRGRASLESYFELFKDGKKTLNDFKMADLAICATHGGGKDLLLHMVDWLLSEAEYCSHLLLLSTGNVLIDTSGEMDKKFFWAPSDHQPIGAKSGNSVRTASQRLKGSFQLLNTIFRYLPITSYGDWQRRYRVLIGIIAASGNKLNLDLSMLGVKDQRELANWVMVMPFVSLISDNTGTAEVHSLTHGLPGYVEAIQVLLEKTGGTRWKLDVLHTLLEASNLICEVGQVRTIVSNLAMARRITDIRVAPTYTKIFHNAFNNLKFPDKLSIMQFFYDVNGAASWQNMDQTFETDLTQAINMLNSQNKSVEYIQKLAKEFSWYFMLGFKYTWWKLLLQVVQMPMVVPIIIEVLRLLKPVVEYRLQGETDGARVILVGVRHLVDENQATSEEQSANWTRFVLALTSDKISTAATKNIQSNTRNITPIITKTEAILTVVLPVLQSSPRLGLKTLLAILDDDTQPDSITWTTVPTPDGLPNRINAFKVFSTILNIYVDSKKKSKTAEETDTSHLCLDALRLLGSIWNVAEIEFSVEDIRQMEKELEEYPWYFRCMVLEQLQSLSTADIRLPLPECVFDVFNFPDHQYESLGCKHAKEHGLECALTALIRVASFSLNLAWEILRTADLDEILTCINNENLNGTLQHALGNVLSEHQSLQEWRNCTELLQLLFGRMLEKSNKGDPLWPGLLIVGPIGKLCETVGQMIRDKSPIAATAIRNCAIMVNDTYVERIRSLDKLDAKFYAWESLYLRCCGLLTCSNRQSTEIVTLLLKIKDEIIKEFDHLDKETIVTQTSLIKGNMKDMIMKKLGIEKN